MAESPNSWDERVAILAPRGRDGQLIAKKLQSIDFEAVTVPDVASLCQLIREGLGVAVVTEEAIQGAHLQAVREALATQPPWSDLPLILLTPGGDSESGNTWKLVSALGPVGSVSLLERPLRSLTLSTAVEVALRARRRQYEARSLYGDLERMVEERNSELISKNLELEGFTYSVSHDLRAPLRAIVSRSRIVIDEESASLTADGVEHLNRLGMAANKMAELVDDLLAYARIGMQSVESERVDVGLLAQEVAAEVQLEDAACAIEFRIEADSNAICDPRLVGMAIRNLLENACKYHSPGETADVVFGAKSIEGERVFYVEDQGIGFDMAYVGKLFKPFERLHNEQYKGTGIGLANVRRIVERHHGRVWAEGTPGKGSSFFFTLG